MKKSIFRAASFACGFVFAVAFRGEGATLRGGSTDVVVDSDAALVVRFAADEMTNFLSQVLGAPVPVVDAPRVGRTSVILGDSRWSRAEGLSVADLPRDAFITKSTPDRVYLLGRDDPSHDPYGALEAGGKGARTMIFERATAFAVYDFLERHADCRFFFPGELGTDVPHREKVEVPEGERTVAPVFTERHYAGHREHGDSCVPGLTMHALQSLNRIRLRLSTYRIPCCHGQRHFKYVARFGKAHPEYFCLKKDGTRNLRDLPSVPTWKNCKLCYSSGVREEIYQDLKAYLTRQPASSRGLDAWPKVYSEGRYVDVMPEDGFEPCFCERCQAAYTKDPWYASELIWGMVADFGRRLIKEGIKGEVVNMAYPPYAGLPSFDLPTNVLVHLAMSGPWMLSNGEENERQFAELAAWTRKTGRKTWLWTYPGKFSDRFPCIPQIAPRAYARFFSRAAPYIFGAYAETESDRFAYDALNVYLFSKICWDPSLDAEALIADYHRRMFGAAAPQMAAVHDALEKKWMQGVKSPVAVRPKLKAGDRTDDDLFEKVYTPEILEALTMRFEKAGKAVAPGSIQARRVAFMKSELLDPLVKRAETFNRQANAAYAPKAGAFGLGRLIMPVRPTPDTPVVLAIHGGGWSAGDRKSWEGVARFWRDELNCAVFNIEYRLASPTNRWPACGNDCVAAAKWILSPAFTELSGGVLKPKKIWICGGSAGGHLTLWTLTHLPPDSVAGAVSISAVGDPMPDFAVHAGRYRALFGRGVKPAALAAMDPRGAIVSGMAPLLCTHAEGDQVVPIASHRAFADAYREAGNRCEFFSYPCNVQPGLTGHCIWRPGSHPHRLIGPIEDRIRGFFLAVRKGER